MLEVLKKDLPLPTSKSLRYLHVTIKVVVKSGAVRAFYPLQAALNANGERKYL